MLLQKRLNIEGVVENIVAFLNSSSIVNCLLKIVNGALFLRIFFTGPAATWTIFFLELVAPKKFLRTLVRCL